MVSVSSGLGAAQLKAALWVERDGLAVEGDVEPGAALVPSRPVIWPATLMGSSAASRWSDVPSGERGIDLALPVLIARRCNLHGIDAP